MTTNYTNTAASLLFKVKKTQLEMMRDRGYDISREEALFEYSVGDFIEQYTRIAQENNTTFKDSLSSLYQKPDGDYVYVHYPETLRDTHQVSKAQITDLISKIQDFSGVSDIIVISEHPIRGEAQKEFQNLPSYNMESFLYDELSYNPTKHELVPLHILLSDEEASEYLKRNRSKVSQLPLISVNDPIARYYGARPGKIMRIMRNPVGIYKEGISTEVVSRTYPTVRLVADIPLN